MKRHQLLLAALGTALPVPVDNRFVAFTVLAVAEVYFPAPAAVWGRISNLRIDYDSSVALEDFDNLKIEYS